MNLHLLIAIIAASLVGAPHKFEDGFVERTCAVQVDGKTGTVKYQIGLNEVTIQALLEQWEKENSVLPLPKPSGTQIDSSKNSSHKSPPPSSLGPDSSATTPGKDLKSDSPSPKPTPNPVAETEELQKKNPTTHRPKQPEAPNATQLNEGAPTGQAEPTVDEDPITDEVLDKFKSIAGKEIAKRFKIQFESQTVAIKSVTVEKAPRHPFVLLVQFEFELPEFDEGQLQISDENFREQAGAVRYSLKGVEDTMLLKSNVAPIVIRAKRVELTGLSEKETGEITSISAKLARMSTSEKDK